MRTLIRPRRYHKPLENRLRTVPGNVINVCQCRLIEDKPLSVQGERFHPQILSGAVVVASVLLSDSPFLYLSSLFQRASIGSRNPARFTGRIPGKLDRNRCGKRRKKQEHDSRDVITQDHVAGGEPQCVERAAPEIHDRATTRDYRGKNG